MLCRSFDELQRHDSIVAAFHPLRTDDLKPGVAAYIGVVLRWSAAWIIEPGENEYAGQFAMMPDADTLYPFAWVPACDLRVVGEG